MKEMLLVFDLATFIVGLLITVVLCFIAYILYSIKKCLDDEAETTISVLPVCREDFNDEYEEFKP